jgi:hypothetical protein
MSREKHITDAIIEKLGSLSGIRIYEQILLNKYETYQFDYVGIFGSTDERFTEAMEDMSAVSDLGKIDLFLLLGNSIKKAPTVGSAKLRNVMQDLSERVEWCLQDFRIDFYKTDFETTTFSPVHYIASEPITYSDDETKGLTLMTFRIFYTRIS